MRGTITLSASEAEGMAIRCEDVSKILDKLLEGALASTDQRDHKRITLITMAKDRNRYLKWVAQKLRGEA